MIDLFDSLTDELQAVLSPNAEAEAAEIGRQRALVPQWSKVSARRLACRFAGLLATEPADTWETLRNVEQAAYEAARFAKDGMV